MSSFTFLEGWEGEQGDWTFEGTDDPNSITTDAAYGCTHSLAVTQTGSGEGWWYNTNPTGGGAQDNQYWLGCALRFPTGYIASLGEGETQMLPTFHLDGVNLLVLAANVILDTGQLFIADNFAGNTIISAALNEEQWYLLEIAAEINSADESVSYEIWLDGVQLAAATTAAGVVADGEAIDGLAVGTLNAVGTTFFVDTFAWNESGQVGEVQPTDEEPCSTAGQSFPRSPLWRWIATTLNPQTLTDLSQVATGRRIEYRLNGPAVATCTVPADSPKVNILDAGDPFVEEGVRCLLGFRREGGFPPWVIRYAGLILLTGDAAESEDADTLVTAYDPWKYLERRPVQCLDLTNCPEGYLMPTGGVLPGPDGMSFGATEAGVVALTLLRNTIVNDGDCFIDAGAAWGGTGFYAGTIETTTQIDINFQQGLSVAEAWRQLVETGEVDLILRPIYDPINRPGILCELDVYAEAGETRFDAVFGWDQGPRSLVGTNRTKDGTQRANRIQLYQDQGGDPVTLQSDATSIARYGNYWYQQFYPVQTQDIPVESLAALMLQLRADGKTVVTVNPAPERSPSPFTEYYLGDTVPIYASSKFRREMSGFQRIYGIPVDIDDNGVETVRELITTIEGGGE